MEDRLTPYNLGARLITPDDRDMCMGFDCGGEPWELEVRTFLRETIWRGGRPKSEETHLGLLMETGDLFGFATWKHRDLDGYGTVIDLAWLAVQTVFKSETDHDGNKLADRLYAYTEEVARESPSSTDEMPVHLVCDERNERGLRFWVRNGFDEIGRVTPPPGDVTYVRMIRA